MTSNDQDYIIIGREVGHITLPGDAHPTHYLHGDGTVDAEPAKNGVDGMPLSVGTIGQKMVELSRGAALQPGTPAYEQTAKEIKYALEVVDKSAEGNMSAEQKQAILDATTVVLDFDTRDKGADPHANTRILVVPADGSIAKEADELSGAQSGQGFKPPLSYPLDIQLMAAYRRDQVLTMLDSFAPANPDHQLSAAQKQALRDHVDAWIDDEVSLPGGGAQDLKEDVLNKPLDAFHRAVGIYITQMCK